MEQHNNGATRIVGIGASAGGLEALSALLGALPTDLNHTYIVVQHLSPTYRSMLTELLARETRLPVMELTDQQVPLPNSVFITPPNRNVSYEAGRFILREPDANHIPKPSVNLFLASLAEHAGEQSVAIILSGTGSDGAQGARAVKAAGGIVFAQRPETAKYDGMPRAVIDTGCADLVLAPSEIAHELATISKLSTKVTLPSEPSEARSSISELLTRVFRHTQVDFLLYKSNTVLRRITRRMTTNKVTSLEDYIALTEKNPDELNQLCAEILISVTAFFRDPDAFSELKTELAKLTASRGAGDEIRIWVPGCATGEEAYTVGMIVAELLGERRLSIKVQIFATDIDANAMAFGRRALYPQSSLSELPSAMREKYFVLTAEGYEVAKAIREMVIFARHDLVQDPPFVRMDLVSCRNVLIYFQLPLQERVLTAFHYALADDGLLLLGKSEGVLDHHELFMAISRETRLFRRKHALTRYPLVARSADLTNPKSRGAVSRTARRLEPLIEHALQTYMPASVLIDTRGELLHVIGDTACFLEIRAGRPELNVFAMIRRELRAELQSLVHHCLQRKAAVVGRTHHFERPTPVVVKLRVHWLAPRRTEEPCLLVAFEIAEASAQQDALPAAVAESAQSESKARDLEDALLASREHLQTLIEELETSNEETQALNEELNASNEELQAANEELQSANEELQSTNEELTTVNEELQVKTAELALANADLESIQNSFGFALLVVNPQLRLLRFNDHAARLFRLTERNLGEPVSVLLERFDLGVQYALIENVIETGNPVEAQLGTADGRHYLMRVFPRLLTGAADPSGANEAIITFIDETALIEAKQHLADSERRLRTIMDNSNALISVKNPLGEYEYVNAPFAALFGRSAAELLSKSDHDLVLPDEAQKLRAAELSVLSSGESLNSEDQITAGGTHHMFRSLRFALRDDRGRITGVCTKMNDITWYFRDRGLWESRLQAWRSFASLDASRLLVEFDESDIVVWSNTPPTALVERFGEPIAVVPGIQLSELLARFGLAAGGEPAECTQGYGHELLRADGGGGLLALWPLEQ